MQNGPSTPEILIFKTKQHFILIMIPLIGSVLLNLIVWALVRATSQSLLFCIRGMTVAVGLFYITRAVIAYATTDLIITNQRAVLREGLLRRHRQGILLSKIESVDIEQAPLCLLFGCGTINIIGTGGTSISLRAAAQPFEVREFVQGLSPELAL